MPDDQWLESEPLNELVQDLAREATGKYRIESADAIEMILEDFESNATLQRAVVENDTAHRLKRTKAFKNAATAAKKKIYYRLRNYRIDAQEIDDLLVQLEQTSPTTPLEKRSQIVSAIVGGHASTRERLPSQDEFYRRLFEQVKPPNRVMDVGCGVHPLMFPFDSAWAREIECYIAVDRNDNDISCINHFARTHQLDQLRGIPWEISEGWSKLTELTGCKQFDVAFMMKVVPVVLRQQRELLPVLVETPATTWLLSGSRVAMAKRRSIEKREKRVLEGFVSHAGRSIQHEFVVDEEFVWIVE